MPAPLRERHEWQSLVGRIAYRHSAASVGPFWAGVGYQVPPLGSYSSAESNRGRSKRPLKPPTTSTLPSSNRVAV